QLADFVRANQIQVQETLKGAGVSMAPGQKETLKQKSDRLTVELTSHGYEPEFDDQEGYLLSIRHMESGTEWTYVDGEWHPSETDDSDFVPLSSEAMIIAAELSDTRDELAEDVNQQDVPRWATQYERWTLPGGGNYRELLLTLPGRPRSWHEARNDLVRQWA